MGLSFPRPTVADSFFDTSILLAYFKNEDARSVSLIQAIIDGRNTGAVSVVTVAELFATTEMDNQIVRIERLALLALMEIIVLDRATAERGGALKRQYDNKLPDALIAASCNKSGGRFFSKDSHFRRLLDAKILTGEIVEA